MRRALELILLVVIFLSGSSGVQAQGSWPTVTFGIGLIKNMIIDRQHSSYSLYPEMEIRKSIFNKLGGQLSVDGSAFVGGWTNGADGLSQDACSNVTHSYRGLIFGARISTALAKSPLGFSLGIARQVRWADYIGGTSMTGDGSDYRDVFNSLELGIGLRLPVTETLLLSGGMRAYWEIPIGRFYNRHVRNAYVINLIYRGD